VSKLIARRLITAAKSNERARLTSYHCNLESECPLLTKGQCINLRSFEKCVYGEIHTRSSATRRARSYSEFVKSAREAMANLPEVKGADRRIAYVGDYIYLPYAHMNHDDGKADLPFLSHSHIFSSGSPFMPRSKFTAAMVVKLFRFKPRTFMDNRVIKKYTDVSLPRFLLDLSEFDPELYAAAVALEPGIAELVARSRPRALTVAEVGGYRGSVRIGGRDYLLYSDGTVEAKVELPDFPTDGPVTVRFTPRPDTPCEVVDREDAIELLKRKQESAA
jgi:hypothetical protein